jgi:hypothetical protein
MEYLKIWTSFRESISPLNDAEKGRLFDAMLLYAETGELPDLKGNERYIWPTAKQAIDRAAQKAETLRQNGNKGGRPPKQAETNGNQTKPKETKQNQTKTNESYLFDKDKENIKEKEEEDKEDTRTREDMPFGLTDDDIQASIDRRQQLEDAARSIGLQVTEAGMMYGERLVQEYGLEKVLDAIKKAVDVPKWAYVEGICKGKGVKSNDNHGDHGTDSAGTRRGKYSFLFDGSQAV